MVTTSHPPIAARHLAQEHEDAILEMFEKIGIDPRPYATPQGTMWASGDVKVKDGLESERRDVRVFMNGLGFLYTRAKAFGSSERRIHTKIDEDLRDREVYVMETRQVMTGTYYGPSGSYDWYEPGRLTDRVSNKICKVSIISRGELTWDNEVPDQQFKGRWIEAKHLEKVSEEVSA